MCSIALFAKPKKRKKSSKSQGHKTMHKWLGCLVMFGVAGCADMQTIGRTTSIPMQDEGPGKAIHLDAQQRLVLVTKSGFYCAEPSPDALASYASSLGFGVSAPSQGAASVAQALQSAAGSIGLRTQSIQLMRDSLYRVCEATANGTLQPLSATLLLARSQDLTAVVVAVEQLTGAVVANQVLLTGSAGASASASLLTNQNLLDSAKEDELAKTKALEDAKGKQTEAKGALDLAKSDEATAKTNHDNADSADKPGLKSIWDGKMADREAAEKRLSDADAMVAIREQQLADSKKNREIIEASRDAALTSAMATTSSSGQFSAPAQAKELSEKSTESIAKAVTVMVGQVLAKDYTADSCMNLLTAEWAKDLGKAATTEIDRTRELCIALINEKIKSQTRAITLTLGEPVKRDVHARRVRAADHVRQLSATDLQIVAQALRIAPGERALGDILTAIAGAQTPNDLNPIADAIKLTCVSETSCDF